MANTIEVKNLTKEYKGFQAVKGVTFAVKKGEIFGFVGPNGAGKTTTISMLCTLLHPTGGEAKVNGHDVVHEQSEVRSSIGIIFQDPALDVELTAWENLYFHAKMYNVPKQVFKSRATELLEFVELSDRANKAVKTFSGGMKRRLEIARGLLHHPKVLFLDEPTIGLDPQTRNSIWEYLKALRDKEQITIFATTHYLPETDNCDRIAIIDQGELVALASPAKLKQHFKAKSMDEVFIKSTGHGIRDEELAHSDQAKADYKTGGGMFRR